MLPRFSFPPKGFTPNQLIRLENHRGCFHRQAYHNERNHWLDSMSEYYVQFFMPIFKFI